MAEPQAKRERLINLLLSIGSITVVLVLFLAGDWLYSRSQSRDPFAPKPLSNNGINLYRRDAASGWYELNGNYRGGDRYGKLDYTVRTDRQGFRSPEHPQHKVTGTSKPPLLLLGDSFTYGVGLNWDDTYPGQLAQLYGGPVINAGVNSHSPTPHLWRLRRWLRQGSIPPGAIIIMGVDISDVFDEATRWSDGPNTPIDRSTALGPAGPASTAKAAAAPAKPFFSPQTFQLSHQIYFGAEALVKHFIDNLQVRNNIRSAFLHRPWSEINHDYQPLGVSGGLAQLQRKVRAAAALSHAHGHRFYLLLYPWPAQLAYRTTFSWPAAMTSICQPPNCNGVINTEPQFARLAASDPNWQDRFYIHGDMHFNAAGNRVIAEQVNAALN